MRYGVPFGAKNNQHKQNKLSATLPRSALSTAALKVVFAFCLRVVAVAVLLWYIARAEGRGWFSYLEKNLIFLGSDEFQDGDQEPL